MAETVKGAGVSQREVAGLRLEADLDSVEGILDVFTNYAGNLMIASDLAAQTQRHGTHRSIDNVLNSLQSAGRGLNKLLRNSVWRCW